MTSTVITTITAADIEQHREQLCQWAEANGLDPQAVAAAPGVTIERSGKRLVIVWRQFQLDDQGRRMVDPADPTVAWTVRKATPLTSPLATHGYPAARSEADHPG
ncbi:hypothetical protein OG384_14910 [Streptomyces sp. NBC_01324]|uniref:hypothetical protein n=1 Tax=Streptomyces sp. NBC_01324 TaxID=2903826 RepID=UPI002E0FE45A|nr:hypothetical protein OG384_14910 [Streptomyces sp. NBC_01324]